MTYNKADKQNSYKSLCQTSVERCEFCDEVFRNRYNSLIHNATHIIIPLINQKAIKCEVCHFYFTSQKEHDKHVLKKHALANGNSTQTEQETIKMRNRLKFEDEDCINFSSDILDNLTSEFKVALNYNKQPDSNNSIVISDDDSDSKNKYVLPISSNQSVLCNSSFKGVCKDVQLNGVNKVNGASEHYDSVHCDLLKMPKCVRCSHCKRKFPDRYNLIIHEATHMDVDRSLPHLCTTCDWYISGTSSNLKRHMKTHLYNNKPTYKPLKHCSHCGLKYRSLVRHANNYHSDWIEEEKYEKIIHVCDLCYEFLKSRTDRCYTKQGTLSEVEKRYTCNQCTRMFFELNIVRTKLVLHNWGMERKIKKKLTNKQRLGKIQNRLLKLNRLRKL